VRGWGWLVRDAESVSFCLAEEYLKGPDGLVEGLIIARVYGHEFGALICGMIISNVWHSSFLKRSFDINTTLQ
jgi:hypothetical protein